MILARRGAPAYPLLRQHQAPGSVRFHRYRRYWFCLSSAVRILVCHKIKLTQLQRKLAPHLEK
jgi:hypothetical protein